MRTYEEICKDLKTAKPGKECRKLHKELHDYGDGAPVYLRYPNVPVVISLSSLLLVLLKLFLGGMLQ